ncbi:hypothetical protein HY468_04925, partial [Candidatus Roizmanbacteria bacterium]|nr:hypothetical protein [Candidatus Roizmanbacteria bacterium]
MIQTKRLPENPILTPNRDNEWESKAVFNGSIVKVNELYHMVYRAMSSRHLHYGHEMNVSSIGTAQSADGIHFHNRRLLLSPDAEWEKFGCEDPRITTFEGKQYILYTALSNFPPAPYDIKIAMAVTYDFKSIEAKHQLTTFNSKAGALFPERINGKVAMIMSVNTDNPPTYIACALADRIEDFQSPQFWEAWLPTSRNFSLNLTRSDADHVEMGAPPLKTEHGWLIMYSYITNYFKPPMTFTIEAVLLDSNDPLKIIGRTGRALLFPQEYYELFGEVPNVVFPTGVYRLENTLAVYYGAGDTSICRADVNYKELIEEMTTSKSEEPVKLARYKGNPILSPTAEHAWEERATFNPTAVYLEDKVHILYRALSAKDVSTIGLAVSRDGFHIDERLPEPIYVPRAPFEMGEDGPYGCEDPRITRIDDQLYMCYTAYGGGGKASVALTSITVADFLKRQWNWKMPIIISPPGIFDKNACVLPEKINDRYALFHRIDHYIWVAYADTLNFDKKKWIEGQIVLKPRHDSWDSLKIGIAGIPVKSEAGWVLLYHGLSRQDNKYRVGAVLLDVTDLDHVLSRLDEPILEPVAPYEVEGDRPDTVFP